MKLFTLQKSFLLLFFFIIAVFFLQNCVKKQASDNTGSINKNNGQEELKESFRNIGWLDDNRYRTGVYILTKEECSTSRSSEIDDRIKMESFKHLQKELNPSFNRNAAAQIKSLIDNYGKVITAGKSCIESNVYFFDIEKNDLKSDFVNIKNIK